MTEKPELEEILEVILSSKEKPNYNPQLVQQYISNLPNAETLTRSQLKSGLKGLEQYSTFLPKNDEFKTTIDSKIEEYKSRLELTKPSKWGLAKNVLFGAGLVGGAAVTLTGLYYAAGHVSAAFFGFMTGAAFPDSRHPMKKHEILATGISGALCSTLLYSIPNEHIPQGLMLMFSIIAGAFVGRYASLKIMDHIKDEND